MAQTSYHHTYKSFNMMSLEVIGHPEADVSHDCKATATRAILHSRLQCNPQKLLLCYRTEQKLQPSYTVHWQYLLIAKLPDYYT